MEEVSRWGGRHGSEVLTVDGPTVGFSVTGGGGTVVVSVSDTGDTVHFAVTDGPVEGVAVVGTDRGFVAV